MSETHTLEKIYEVIASRKGGDETKSYTAKLLKKGTRKISQKVGEEAVETVIAALAEDRKALAAESADLLYHLMVLWVSRGIEPEDVWTELRNRLSQSGLDEKKSRGSEA